MKNITINENITALVSDETVSSLERDEAFYALRSCFLDEEYAWLIFGVEFDLAQYPDWFWNYEPIRVFNI